MIKCGSELLMQIEHYHKEKACRNGADAKWTNYRNVAFGHFVILHIWEAEICLYESMCDEMVLHGSTTPLLVFVYFNLQDNADSHGHLCPVCFDSIFV